jgi:hypothetical protein
MHPDFFHGMKSEICADLRHALDNCYFSKNLEGLLENLEQLAGIAEGEMATICNVLKIENNEEEYEKQ